jgi:hypothetical protein
MAGEDKSEKLEYTRGRATTKDALRAHIRRSFIDLEHPRG